MLDTQFELKPTVPKLHAIPTSQASSAALHTRSVHANQQLWLHIHLHQFGLDVLTPGNTNKQACVLISGEGKRLRVELANKHANHLGVRTGMPLAAAEILGDLTVVSRDERAEQRALERLCAWAYQFTPIVSTVPADGLLLEIKGSLKLFGGVEQLLNRIRRGLRELGYRAALAVAPTPLAATVLARSQEQKIILSEDELTNALSRLPLDALRLEPKQSAVLASIGARSIGDCLRLPRGGLGRRTAPQLIETFRRLLGQAPDPRAHFNLPKLFQSAIEIPWETSSAQSLSIAGERLLHELVGYLRSCDAMTRRLRWSLSGAQGGMTNFQIDLTHPSREHGHFLLLLREQLTRMQLKGHIKRLALYVDDITVAASPAEGDLFTQRSAGNVEDWPSFLDRLRARLGERAVRGLQRVADHRPECAWRWSNLSSNKGSAGNGQNRECEEPRERPLWLMRRPLRLSAKQGGLDINGPLRFLEERERIETGWWDGKAIGRDYFVAANPSGARLWIYRELSGDKNWYLHGIFE